MTNTQLAVTVAMMVLGTLLTRFLPFLCFPDNRRTPDFVVYIGKVLPYAAIGLLVVYCLKDISLTSSPFGLPELIAVACVAALHLWKRSTLLSIAGGTAVYMLLVQTALFG